MAFWQYRPFSIRLPEDSPLRRMMVACDPVRDGPPWPTAAEAARFDDRTVFWDIRWDQNTGNLTALGPPLENLAAQIGDIRLTVEQEGTTMAEGLAMRPERLGPSVIRYTSEAPLKLGPRKQKTVSAWSGETALGQTKLIGHRRQIGEIFAVSMQRNADPDHLCDWLDYLEWHGIDGAVIYDDGSENHAELRDRLRDRQTGQSVLFVDWPMPVGPTRFPRLCYARDGHITHAAHWFHRARWMLALPMHGFPTVAKQARLADLLDRQKPATGAVELRGRGLWAQDRARADRARNLTEVDARADGPVIRAVRLEAVDHTDTEQVTLRSGFGIKRLPQRLASCLHALPLISEADPFATPVDLDAVHDDRKHVHIETMQEVFRQIDSSLPV